MLWNDRLMIDPLFFMPTNKDLRISEAVASMQYIVANVGEALAAVIEIDWRAKLSVHWISTAVQGQFRLSI